MQSSLKKFVVPHINNRYCKIQMNLLSLSAKEMVEIVDEKNNILEPCFRFKMREERLIHRATYAFLKAKSNYFYVQKRSMLKDYCPGYLDPTPGGVVAAGESYEETNMREVEEEMGMKGIQMDHFFTFYYEDERIRCFGDAWEGEYDGPLKIQMEEVDSVHMMSMEEILKGNENGINKFTPDSIFACQEYVKRKGFPIIRGERKDPTIIN